MFDHVTQENLSTQNTMFDHVSQEHLSTQNSMLDHVTQEHLSTQNTMFDHVNNSTNEIVIGIETGWFESIRLQQQPTAEKLEPDFQVRPMYILANKYLGTFSNFKNIFKTCFIDFQKLQSR